MSRSREDNREYMREYRSKATASVTSISPDPDLPLTVLAAVESELVGLPLALIRPVDAAAARAMARILDDPASIPQQCPAAARLREIMTDLRAGADGGKGKLAQLRSVRAAG